MARIKDAMAMRTKLLAVKQDMKEANVEHRITQNDSVRHTLQRRLDLLSAFEVVLEWALGMREWPIS